MKKLFLVMLAAAGVAVTSCERSFDDGIAAAGNEAKVSVSIEFPAMQTRAAYSDGTTATELQYAVFEKTDDKLSKIDLYTVDSSKPEEIKISKQVEFQLVTGRTYQFVFWAAAPSEEDWKNPYTVTFTEEGATMEVDYSAILANDERNDAFFASVEKKITGDVQMSVELTRPFAQINVGTSDYEVAKAQDCAPNLSQIELNKAYKKLDLVTGVASGNNGSTTFAYNAIDTKEKFPIDGYKYLAMTYVLAAVEEQADYTVTFYYKENDGEYTKRPVGSVPVQRNHRTNMFGQVLTSTASVNVIIVPEYKEPDHNYSQLLFAAAVGGTAVLDDDVEVQGELTFTKDAVVDLGGHEIKATGGTYGDTFVIGDGANVTMKNGTLNPSSTASETNASATIIIKTASESHLTLEDMTVLGKPYAIYLNSANEASTVTIKSGTYYTESSTNNAPAVYVGKGGKNSTIGGKAIIYGGTFGVKGVVNDFLLNVEDILRKQEGKEPRDFIEVFGGTFYNFDPANNKAEGEGTNFVAEGYKSVCTQEGEDKVYIVVPADTDIISVPTNMSQDDFNDAITNAADNAIFYLGDNVNLKLPSDATVNKNFTFVGNGADNSTITGLNHETATGSNLTFENLTLQVGSGGSATSIGFSGAESVTLKNVTVKGEFHTFSASTAVFEGCTFNHDGINTTDRQGIWCDAYGKTVIKDCIFEVIPPNENGNETKAILIYSDDNKDMGDVEVTNCTFRKGVVSAKACVEIHSEKFTSAGTVTITGCTWDKETYKGGLWREIHNTAEGKPKTKFYTVIVDGVEEQKSAQ